MGSKRAQMWIRGCRPVPGGDDARRRRGGDRVRGCHVRL